MKRYQVLVFGLGGLGAGCSSAPSESRVTTDGAYRQAVTTGMRASLLEHMQSLVTAARDLQQAAPTPVDRGWDTTLDAGPILSMRDAWARARSSYEHIEGATAPIQPDIDFVIDARYEDFLANLTPSGDPDLFDGMGVTGMHAIERILYADVTPARVVTFEATLPGYQLAAFPATAGQAIEFKTGLLTRFIADVETLRDRWQTAKSYDLPAAFEGLVSLMNEQREKVDKASTNEEESRYAQCTMRDMRDNLAGTKMAYSTFRPWIQSRSGISASDGASARDGVSIDAAIMAGFEALDRVYAQVLGDAIPIPSSHWSSENPSNEDLASPFGRLYTGVQGAVDPARPGSVVAEMNLAAAWLGFSPAAGEP